VVKLVIDKDADGEYRVGWWQGGKRLEAKTYYTDDFDDALATAFVEYSKLWREGMFVDVSGRYRDKFYQKYGTEIAEMG